MTTRERAKLFLWCARNIENRVETILFMERLRNTAKVRFRSGLIADCVAEDRSILEALLDLSDEGVRLVESGGASGPYDWKVSWQNKTITTPQGLVFQLQSLNASIFKETFLHDIHFVGYDLESKSVVDVGAFVGDTALYYANLGADVYAYEPNPINYKQMLANLTLNPSLAPRVKPVNKAVGRDGKLTLYYPRKVSGVGTCDLACARSKEVSSEVESASLSTILKEESLDAPYLLKSDCKGCEQSLVRDEAISRFTHLKIEYTLSKGHNVAELVNQLKSRGFAQFRVYKHNYWRYDLGTQGTIMAAKR
jgi:FkbM family methyltransferase